MIRFTHFATQIETAEPVEIQLKDWDAHIFVARLIAVSTQMVALWEAFILLAGTGWGGGLMLTLLVGAKLFYVGRSRFEEAWRWAVSLFGGRAYLGCFFVGWPLQWSNILSSWQTLFGGFALPTTDRENLSESAVPLTPVRNRNRDVSPMSSTPGGRPTRRIPRTLD